MTDADSSPLRIEPVAAEDRRAGLELLLSHLGPESCRREAARLLGLAAEGKTSFAGLFRAGRGPRMLGVVWAQLQPGRMAVLWTPQIFEADTGAAVGSSFEHGAFASDENEVGIQLTFAAVEFAAARVRLIQASLPEREAAEARWFARAGLRHLAELDYMVAQVPSALPAALPSSTLAAVAYRGTKDRQRLEGMLAKTYEGTLDCPGLEGVRDSRDVVEGYLSASPSSDAHWYFLQVEATDAGCLLLAEQKQSDEFEILYVGLAPQYRGRKLGLQAVREAQRLARVAGRQRLILAVDEANAPAQATYASAGFVRYARRSVWVKFFA